MKITLEQLPSDEPIVGSPQAPEILVGATMINGFNKEQIAEARSLFASELTTDPILEINEVQGSEGIFNVTVLKIRGTKYLLGRKVLQTAPEGQPDAGPLVLAELNASRDIISVQEVWTPDGKDIGIEDPRASSDGTIIGISVIRKAEGNKVYPGLIKLESPDQLLAAPFPRPRVIEKFGGGNQTLPLGESVEGKNATTLDNQDHIMYRPEGMTHTLQVLRCTEDDAVHVGFIDFPKNIPWAEYKIGTTAPPEWLNEREAFIELHGINIVDGLFVYAIGTARLLRAEDQNGHVSFSVDNISRQAIITPDTFPPLTDGRQVERHPEIRRAEYNCGALSEWNSAGELIRRELFPSQGDMRTYDAVEDAAAIIATWDRTIPVQFAE